ncbi:MAG: LamG domain-containing protein, partial [Flavobacterium sp.]|uniref:LamG domain-containing protein n=1 Tax=Flavobacterium sp. TaxID=239 RepID=UPI00261429FE
NGIIIYYVNNSNFRNVTSYENYYGFALTESSNNNFITINVSSNSGQGFYFSLSSNNIINNITSNSNSDNGVSISSSSNNNSINNLISNSNSNSGIYIYSSYGNVIQNISIWNCSSTNNACIYMYANTNNNKIENVYLNKSNNYGIRVDGLSSNHNANNNIFKNIKIENTNSYAIYFARYSNNNTLLNVSIYNIANESVANNNNWIIRQWYYKAKVNDSDGNLVSNANVTAYNVSSARIDYNFTGVDGMTGLMILTDYVNTNGARTFYSPYNIYASNSSYVSSNHYINISFGNNYSDFFSLTALDTTPPYFIYTENVSIYINDSVGVDFESDDETLFDCFAVNDTINFAINCSGWLKNITGLSTGIYNLNITINDTSNNINSTIIFVNVSALPDTTAPLISFVSPTPENNNVTTLNFSYVNVSSSDTNQHSTFVDWNRNLILWMRMDDRNSSGGVIDKSSYSNNGSVSGAVYDSSGKFGGSMGFDGINDYIVKDITFVNSFPYTISAWIKTTSSTTEGAAVCYVSSTSTTNYNCIGTNSSVGARLIVRSNGGITNFDYSITAGEWHHLVGVFVSTYNKQFYVDGVNVGNVTTERVFLGENRISVGTIARSGYVSYFNGSVDDVIIFNKTLSSQEILSLYNASASQYYNNFTNLSIGAYTYTAYAQDISGNLNQTEMRYLNISSGIVDYAYVNITSPSDGSEIIRGGAETAEDALGKVFNNITISAKVYGNESLTGIESATCNFYFGNNFIGSNDTNSSGDCSVSYDKSGLENGTYGVFVNYTASGNTIGLSNYSVSVNLSIISIPNFVNNIRTGNYFMIGDAAILMFNFTKNGIYFDPDFISINVTKSDTTPIISYYQVGSNLIKLGAGQYYAKTIVNSSFGNFVRWELYAYDSSRNIIASAIEADRDLVAATGSVNLSVINQSGNSLGFNFSLYDRNNYLLENNSVSNSYKRNVAVDDKYKKLEILTENLSLVFSGLNVSTNVTISPQFISDYSYSLPYGISEIGDVVALNSSFFNFENTTIILSKKGLSIDKICHCISWNFIDKNCSTWECNNSVDYNMQENSTNFWFNVSSFSGYAGGVGFTSNLSIWDSNETQLILTEQQAYFYANYTNSSTGLSINGTGVNCSLELNISGDWISYDMNFNSTSFLYEYNQTFSSAGIYNWNVTCNGSIFSYEILEANDTIGIAFVPDTTAPYFTSIPSSTSITYLEGFGVDFESDDETAFDSYAINFSSLFQINSSGFLENKTRLAAGTYLVNVSINDSSNNLNSTIYEIIVGKAGSQTSLTFDKISPQEYPISITPTCAIILGEGSADLTNATSGNSYIFSSNIWSFNCSVDDSENYSGSSNFSNFTISKNNSYVLSLSASPSWEETAGVETTITGSGCPSELVCNLTRNLVEVLNPDVQILSAGNYAYNYSSSGNENYSASSINNSLTISLDLIYPTFSNYWDNNASLVGEGLAEFNVSVLNTNGSVYLNINGSSFAASNLTANMFNVSVYLINGTYSYNWSAYGNGTSHNLNYSNTRNYFVNNSPDTTSPSVKIILPANTTYSSTNISLNVSSTATDIDSWWYSLNLGETNTTFTPNSTFIGSEGSNNLFVYVNDSSNNLNFSSVIFSIDTTPPLILFISPMNTTYSYENISVNISSDSTKSSIWYFNGTANVSYSEVHNLTLA